MRHRLFRAQSQRRSTDEQLLQQVAALGVEPGHQLAPGRRRWVHWKRESIRLFMVERATIRDLQGNGL